MSAKILRFRVDKSYHGKRIDAYLSIKIPHLSRSYIAKLIEDGQLTLDEESNFLKNSHRLKGDELLTLEIPEAKKLDIEAENIDIDIVFEDNNIIVVNKPCGMVVHPVGDVVSGTLVNALLDRIDPGADIGGIERPGIVHRLDKETTGLMVVAKNDFSHRWLSDQFKQRLIDKTYLAIAKGVFKEDEMPVHAPIGRHPNHRYKMSVQWTGKTANTIFRVQERFAAHTLVACDLLTGRTHQIRVHLNHINYPILGDKTYGGRQNSDDEKMGRVALHAWKLGFFHPLTGQHLNFEQAPPEDFQQMLVELRKSMVL
jgi:23S rRNA pseudouridine1911/1915/1917 synthase